MDLAVCRPQPVAIDHHEGVERAVRVVADLEHAGDHGGVVLRGELGQPSHEGTIELLRERGDVRGRLAEVAHEGLGEQHQAGARLEPLAESTEGVPVLRRVQGRRLLQQGTPKTAHGASLPD